MDGNDDSTSTNYPNWKRVKDLIVKFSFAGNIAGGRTNPEILIHAKDDNSIRSPPVKGNASSGDISVSDDQNANRTIKRSAVNLRRKATPCEEGREKRRGWIPPHAYENYNEALQRDAVKSEETANTKFSKEMMFEIDDIMKKFVKKQFVDEVTGVRITADQETTEKDRNQTEQLSECAQDVKEDDHLEELASELLDAKRLLQRLEAAVSQLKMKISRIDENLAKRQAARSRQSRLDQFEQPITENNETLTYATLDGPSEEEKKSAMGANTKEPYNHDTDLTLMQLVEEPKPNTNEAKSAEKVEKEPVPLNVLHLQTEDETRRKIATENEDTNYIEYGKSASTQECSSDLTSTTHAEFFNHEEKPSNCNIKRTYSGSENFNDDVVTSVSGHKSEDVKHASESSNEKHLKNEQISSPDSVDVVHSDQQTRGCMPNLTANEVQEENNERPSWRKQESFTSTVTYETNSNKARGYRRLVSELEMKIKQRSDYSNSAQEKCHYDDENYQEDRNLITVEEREKLLIATSCDGVSRAIWGLTMMGDEIFVLRDENPVLEIWNLSEMRLKIIAVLKGFVMDIVSDANKEYLYISRVKAQERWTTISRYNKTGQKELEWSVLFGGYATLSITYDSTVLVTLKEHRKLIEYTSEGDEVLMVELKALPNPLHAIKHSDDRYIVSQGDTGDSVHQVLLINANGSVLRSFYNARNVQPSRMNVPMYLLNVNGSILVADNRNRRVLQLNSTSLQCEKVLLEEEEELSGPCRLHLDKNSSRLVVATNQHGWKAGKILIYQM